MGLRGYLLKRLLLMVPTLFGITLVTFLLMDLAPSSRAEIHLGDQMVGTPSGTQGAKRYDKTLQALREHWGMIDPVTKKPYSVWRRYAQWLGRACTLDFVGPGEDVVGFRRRIHAALPVTLLLNTLALLLALSIAIPVGARLGMSVGGLLDRSLSSAMDRNS